MEGDEEEGIFIGMRRDDDPEDTQNDNVNGTPSRYRTNWLGGEGEVDAASESSSKWHYHTFYRMNPDVDPSEWDLDNLYNGYRASQTANTGKSKIKIETQPSTGPQPRPRDWNGEFQSLLDSLSRIAVDASETFSQYSRLKTLIFDFVSVAKLYGVIIISELGLPEEEKTIAPAKEYGGEAGGVKYVAQGILFKLAIDPGYYGGNEYAAKAAGHDLRSLVAFHRSSVRGLHVPMMCLIDFRGFRLIAQSLLPIKGSESIVYGSFDGGRAGCKIYNTDDIFGGLMEEAASKLNIAGHCAGPESTFIWGPADIEGHIGSDGRRYVLDFHRMMPPEAPDPRIPGSFLYKLLRPEFVRKYLVALSSDVFSRFSSVNDVNFASFNREAVRAAEHLYSVVIPSFASMLSNLDEHTFDEFQLVEQLHLAGINVRHLGRVRAHVTSQRVRDRILIEIVVRTMKNLIREQWRASMMREEMSEEPFIQAALCVFNYIIGNGDTWENASTDFWIRTLPFEIDKRFPYALSEKEVLSGVGLRDGMDMVALFNQVRQIHIVEFSEVAFRQLKDDPAHFYFVEPDILQTRAQVSQMNLIDHAEGSALYLQSLMTTGAESERLLDRAAHKYKAALSSTPDNYQTLIQWGNALYRQAVNMARRRLRGADPMPRTVDIRSHFSQAIDRFALALKIQPGYHRTLYRWGDLLCDMAQYATLIQLDDSPRDLLVQAGEKYRAALAQNSDYHPCLRPWICNVTDDVSVALLVITAQRDGRYDSVSKSAENATFAFTHSMSSVAIGSPIRVPHRTSPNPHRSASMEGLRLDALLGNLAPSLDIIARTEDKKSIGDRCSRAMDVNFSDWSCFVSDSLVLELMNASSCIVRLVLPNAMYVTEATLVAAACKLTNLQYLDLTKCAEATDLSLASFLRSCSELIVLRASHCPLSRDGLLDPDIPTLPNDLKLVELTLSFTDIGNPVISAIVSKCTGLQRLDLSNCHNLGDDALMSVAKSCPELEELSVAKCRVSDKSISEIAKRCRQLSVLNLEACKRVTDASLLSLVYNHASLSQLIISKCQLITDQSIIAFANACGGELKVIGLSDIPNITGTSLLELLARSFKLESLDLCGAGWNVTSKVSRQISEHTLSLRRLCLSRSPRLVSDDDIQAIGMSCLHLEHLELNGADKLSDSGCEALVNGGLTSLRSLSLADCRRLTDRGVTSIMRASTRLVYLNLKKVTQVTDVSIECAAEYCHALSQLYLDGGNAGSPIISRSIAVLAAGCPNLTHLELVNLVKINDDALCSLGEHCPLLTHLCVKNCRQLTVHAVEVILKSCRHLKGLDVGHIKAINDNALHYILQFGTSLERIVIQITEKSQQQLANELPALKIVVSL